MGENLRTYISKINEGMEGKELEISGWVHETRDHGGIRFLILRDVSGSIQVTGKSKDVSEEVFNNLNLPKETVVTIKGKIKKESQAPGGVELIPSSINVLNKVGIQLPVDPTNRLISDLDVRLDNRHIDLRRKNVQAIFGIQSEILHAFRDKSRKLGCKEIVTPCLTGAATEGGTEVFPVVYFDREAFLCQSPQLYKQLAVVGGMEKVFMTVPVFRAEKHKTTSHINQILQMDVEMGFADHNDVMKVLKQIFLHILSSVKKNCKKQLGDLGVDFPIPKNIKKHTYSQMVDILNSKGTGFEWGEDIGRDEEKVIYEELSAKGEEAYYIVDFPTEIKPFYAMPNKKKPKVCNSFDLMYRGMEMASGTQRIHIPELLIQSLKDKGLNPANFEFYVNAFRSGAPPHAGWSIGLERLTMMITKQPNIRECSLFPRDIDRLSP